MSTTLDKSSVLFKQRVYRQAGIYKGRLDGIHGAKTEQAENEWESIYRHHRLLHGGLDMRSEGNIFTVLPLLQGKIRQLMNLWIKEGLRVKVLSGTRTYAEQNALYAQGRTKPGLRVTKARGGYSNHNFALAVDIGLFSLEGAYLDNSPLYDVAVEVSRSINGLSRGADWKTPDRPHYELDHGLKISEVRRRFEAGELIMTRDNK